MHGRILRDDFIRLRSGDERRSGHLRQRLAPTAFAVVAATLHVAAAGWLLMQAADSDPALPLASVAIVIMFGVGAWYAVLAGRIACGRTVPQAVVPPCRPYALFVGVSVVVSYAVAMVGGGRSAAPYLFSLLLAVSHAGAWFILSSLGGRPKFLALLFERRLFRAGAWTLFVALMAPLAGELGLRVYAFSVGDPLMARYVTDGLKLSPGGDRFGQTVNSQGYWDDEFPVVRRGGGLRVAALGDETVLCGDAESNFLVQIERQMPGVEILNFGVPEASPREYAAQVETSVASCRPDIVLVCVSVATDVTDAPELPGAFDWRGLHLVQRSLNLAGRNRSRDRLDECGDASTADVRRECLDEIARQLEVCRVPVEEPLRARWRAAFEHLDEILRRCRAEEIEPMLVVLPGEFQVDDGLLQTLCRRAGYRSDQIDIDLPQRRLAAYAKDRRVQMIDLMPHLRASRRPSFRCNAAHFNRHGNSLAADILCDWLESRYDATLLARGG